MKKRCNHNGYSVFKFQEKSAICSLNHTKTSQVQRTAKKATSGITQSRLILVCPANNLGKISPTFLQKANTFLARCINRIVSYIGTLHLKITARAEAQADPMRHRIKRD
jgi:hypothetical protein